jgi:hypothetical protein
MERKAVDAYLQHATLNLITMAIAAELARVSPAAKPPYLGKGIQMQMKNRIIAE